MIRAEVLEEHPKITCKIVRTTTTITGKIVKTMPTITGKIMKTPAQIVGRIKRKVEHEPEPYYEVANEFGGLTIIIGE